MGLKTAAQYVESLRDGRVTYWDGDNIPDILVRLTKHGLTLRQIIVTHAHIDHVGGAVLLRKATWAPVLLNQKDIALLDSTWDQVKALRPISYTQAEHTPESSKKPLFIADDIVRWGFLAHELQETLLPTAASGTKDAKDEIQSPNMLAIVAALTKALQEAMARIEALEARGS